MDGNNEQCIDKFLGLTPETPLDKGYKEITDFYFDEKEDLVQNEETEGIFIISEKKIGYKNQQGLEVEERINSPISRNYDWRELGPASATPL
ncbi:6218_t:CDS:2 [Scutellospora calospora]|uniref:6218_t:CDS:1 n=1 Tax=Scutellospora calospora TaxID=85575 RepID=A0ACA9KZE4_9GLOM|nr:6218_t:CDS:2 [Scutellospora calospora]